MKLTKGRIVAWCVCFPIIAIVIIGVCIGNAMLYKFEDTITPFLCPPIVDQQAAESARASGQALSDQIVQEGSVLVKNDNDTLPLSIDDDDKVNVFGWTSIDWVFGGSGSGQVFADGSDPLDKTVGILEALTAYGIEYNTELTDMYKKYHARIGDRGSISTWQRDFYALCQPSISDYPASVLNGAKNYSDTALAVISRRAGETEDPTRVQYKADGKGTDNSRTYLEISSQEEEMLKYVGANFEKVVVIINSTNVMELGFLRTIPGLDACLVVGATGTTGAKGVPAVLYGRAVTTDEDGVEEETRISPSGHFSDTYPYEFESNINYLYSGDVGVGHYVGASGLYPDGTSRNAGEQYTTATYVDYIEGIYVGYKWYETADVMGVWKGRSRTVLDAGGNEVTLGDYDSVVQFPFGFGMSYTKFDWEVTSVKMTDEDLKLEDADYKQGAAFTEKTSITVNLKVTNSGEYFGRDVVQVYLTAPYKGTIEKSHVSLIGFAKTINLAPNGSQDLSITLDPYDFASYDCYDANDNDFAGYELEDGDYLVKLMTDAHNVKKVTMNGAETDGVLTFNLKEGIKIGKDKYTKSDVFNKFTGDDAKEALPIDGSKASVPVEYITREDFPDPFTFAAPTDREMTEEEKVLNLYDKSYADEWDAATTDLWGNEIDRSPVKWGQKGDGKVEANGALTDLGKKLAADYNAPEWKSLLDQVTIDEAINLATRGAFGNQAVESIGKKFLYDYDGPAQVRSFNAGDYTKKGTGFPCSATMSQTWSSSLVYAFGINYGKEMDAAGVSGAYAFGCNLHRSPFAGRNYEYLSEDGFLSAVLLSQEVKGLKNMGKYTYLKHLVLGECEHDREAMYTWLTEQALREIYLKPFQKAIQEGGCVGIMSSYNRIGNVWTGGSESLVTGILRNEWGFNGSIVTDYADHPIYMNGDQSVRAGCDLSMAASFHYGTASKSDIENKPRLAHRFREIVHQVTYTYINARYTNSVYNEADDVEAFYASSSMQPWIWWKPLLACVDVVVALGALVGVYFLLRPLFAARLGLVKVPASATAAGASDQTGQTEREQTELSERASEEKAADGTTAETAEENPSEPPPEKAEGKSAPKKKRTPGRGKKEKEPKEDEE